MGLNLLNGIYLEGHLITLLLRGTPCTGLCKLGTPLPLLGHSYTGNLYSGDEWSQPLPWDLFRETLNYIQIDLSESQIMIPFNQFYQS